MVRTVEKIGQACRKLIAHFVKAGERVETGSSAVNKSESLPRIDCLGHDHGHCQAGLPGDLAVFAGSGKQNAALIRPE